MKKLTRNSNYALQLNEEELIALQLAVLIMVENDRTHERWLKALAKVDKVLTIETQRIDSALDYI